MYAFLFLQHLQEHNRNIGNQTPSGPPNMRESKKYKVVFILYFVLDMGSAFQNSVYSANAVNFIAKI